MTTTTTTRLIEGFDHVQVAVPRSEEAAAKAFYGEVLGLEEIAKPAAVQARGGAWYRCGNQELHVGLDDEFTAPKKAHPAFLVSDLAAMQQRLEQADAPITTDVPLPGYARIMARDPFGNRLEFMQCIAADNGNAHEQDTASTSAAADIKERVREAFGRTAEAYVTSPAHATGDDLLRLLALAVPQPSDYALDISTGGGHVALALAPQVARVTASDLTPRMLAAARNFLTAQGHHNVDYVVADAEKLPFLDASFDLVTVRIAPHHYADVQAAVSEMARVLVPGGRLIIIDNVAPENDELDQYLNQWEERRDPSHVREYKVSEWQNFVRAAGLTLHKVEIQRKQHDYASWVERMQMPAAERERLAADILAAPQQVRDYFEVHAENGQLTDWSADYIILRATR